MTTIEDLQNQITDLARLIRRHTHDGIETEEITTTSSSSANAWELVSHSTTTDNLILIEDLNLQTDLQYHILVKCRNITLGGIVKARLNNDSGLDGGGRGKHTWAVQAYMQESGVGANENNAGNDSDLEWELNHPSGNTSHYISMFLSYNSGTTLATWTCASTGDGSSNYNDPSTANGAGYWNSSENITSIQFEHNSGIECVWDVVIYKANIT